MRIVVTQNQRGILLIDERPVRYLMPGVYRVWRWRAKVSVSMYPIDRLVADVAPEHLALIPSTELNVVEVGEGERLLLERFGKPAAWLGPGQHAIWVGQTWERRNKRGEPERLPVVTLKRIDTSGISVTPLARDLLKVVRSDDYTEITVPQGSAGLRHVDGVLDAVLDPGRHAAWTTERKVTFAAVDLREQLLAIVGQEVMTKDRVTLRLNVSATYRVVDVRLQAAAAKAPYDALYLAVQLVTREAVAGHTLDELLADREALAERLRGQLAGRAAALGLELLSLGVKDVVLPGDMKALLNRVIEARKQAEANVILRREEIAATRSMAQTAQVLAENPVLMRLKELEAYKELAATVGKVDVVVGSQDLLADLRLLRPS